MMNNYFHDVATAMLFACSATMLIFLDRLKLSCPDSAAFIKTVYGRMSKVFWFSVIWVIAGGTIRFGTLYSFEWKNAVLKGHTDGLIAKYVIASIMLIAGIALWSVVRKRLRDLGSKS
ncbi:MAG: hypothetical protein EPN22_12955 [Nitrospirae bacterium]|nr:MAG: hypothetical protein EPN22_12955 [Nitrospirota bacterium]